MPNCGGRDQPPCKPVPTAVVNEVPHWTEEQVDAYGHECYQRGRVDERMVPHPADN